MGPEMGDGFWIVHSMPAFPHREKNDPEFFFGIGQLRNGRDFMPPNIYHEGQGGFRGRGQVALCVSFPLILSAARAHAF